MAKHACVAHGRGSVFVTFRGCNGCQLTPKLMCVQMQIHMSHMQSNSFVAPDVDLLALSGVYFILFPFFSTEHTDRQHFSATGCEPLCLTQT